MSSSEPNQESQSSEVKRPLVRTSTDLQRLRLERLMKNPEKPIIIPERPKDPTFSAVPDFVRNVMGSSAGAGSGEFHVYRHLRRKEYARQRYMKEKGFKERLDDEYQQKLLQNKQNAEEKTAKKRQKRIKKKQIAKLKRAKSLNEPKKETSSSDSTFSDENDDNSNANKNTIEECCIDNAIDKSTPSNEEDILQNDKTDLTSST